MKIIHADDHPLFREGIEYFLRSLAEVVTIIPADNIELAQQLLQQHSDTNLLILDINMPGMEHLTGFFQLRRRYPHLKIVIMSSEEHTQIISELIEAGARGFIPKSCESKDMITAIGNILDGEIVLPDRFKSLETKAPDEATLKFPLTDRQLDVLRLLMDGESNKAIANRLFISEGTVKNHLKSIFKTLGANSRTQAINIALNKNVLLNGTS